MHPLLFLIPGGLLLYMLASKQKQSQTAAIQQAGKAPPSLPYSTPSGGAHTLTTDQSPSANAGNYIQHLNNAQDAVDTLNSADALHPDAVLDAYNSLSAPMDTLTIQKDLNVLGATPSLVEDGVMGPKTKEAIATFQTKMGLPSTGVMDPNTNMALRHAAVTIAYS